MGDAQKPIAQALTQQQSDDAIGEDMKSWGAIAYAVTPFSNVIGLASLGCSTE